MGGVGGGAKPHDVRKSTSTKASAAIKRANTESNDEGNLRLTTNNLMSEENLMEIVSKKTLDKYEGINTIKEENIIEQVSKVDFNPIEEVKETRYNKGHQKISSKFSSNKYKSKEIDSVISESSVIKSKHKRNIKGFNSSKLRLEELENLGCTDSMKSVLNFNPDDVIAKRGNTYRTRKSYATSGTIIKTPHGIEFINKIRPLKDQQPNEGRLKLNKRQQSENQKLRISEEMMKIIHKHHLSSGDNNFIMLNHSKMKRLENAKDEEEFLREISNYMEPGEIEGIFSGENRLSLNIAKENNSIQLSTLSTNPQKREKSRKNKNDGSAMIANIDKLKFNDKQALIEDNSVIYDENIQVEGDSAAVGPNEAMYFNGDSIPISQMLSFEEAIQRQKEILDKSSKVNQGSMPVWNSLKHTKNKFYKKDIIEPDETKMLFESLESDIEYKLMKIDEMAGDPGILDKKLEKTKIVQGKMPPSISIAGAILS